MFVGPVFFAAITFHFPTSHDSVLTEQTNKRIQEERRINKLPIFNSFCLGNRGKKVIERKSQYNDIRLTGFFIYAQIIYLYELLQSLKTFNIMKMWAQKEKK